MHPKYRTTGSPWTEWMDYVGESIGELKDTSRLGMGRYVDLYSLALNEYTIRPHQHPDEDAHTAYADLLAHIFDTQFGDDK